MEPIKQTVFSVDYHAFVLQDLMKPMPPQEVHQEKKFDLKGADKSKKAKDAEKDKEKKKKPFNFD